MNQDARGWQLHDRATRGEALSSDEHAELVLWYEAQDQAEAAILGDDRDDVSVAALRAQVRVSMRRLQTVAQEIERLAAENERLRQEIAASQRQLARPGAARSA